jgi:hypothetical protein
MKSRTLALLKFFMLSVRSQNEATNTHLMEKTAMIRVGDTASKRNPPFVK